MMNWFKAARNQPHQHQAVNGKDEAFTSVLPEAHPTSAIPSSKVPAPVIPMAQRRKEIEVPDPAPSHSHHQRSVSSAPSLSLPDPDADAAAEANPAEERRSRLEEFRFACSEIVPGFLYVSGEEVARDATALSRVGITHVINCAGPHCPNYHETAAAASSSSNGSSSAQSIKYLRLDFYDSASEDLAWFLYPALDFIDNAAQQSSAATSSSSTTSSSNSSGAGDSSRRNGEEGGSGGGNSCARSSNGGCSGGSSSSSVDCNGASSCGTDTNPSGRSGSSGGGGGTGGGARVLVHCAQGVSRSCALAAAWLMYAHNLSYRDAYTRVRAARAICAPNAGFACALLEWERRRAAAAAAVPPPQLLLRTAYHSPLFPGDQVLKLCTDTATRAPLAPRVGLLDPAACFVVVGCAAAAAAATAAATAAAADPGLQQHHTNASVASKEVATAEDAGVCAAVTAAATAAAAAAASATACSAAEAAADAAPATVPPLEAAAAAAAATSAQTTAEQHSAVPAAAAEAAAAAAAAAATPEALCRPVWVWQGAHRQPGMAQLAQRGAAWVRKFEGCCAPRSVTISQGEETPAFLAAMGHAGPLPVAIAPPKSPGGHCLYGDVAPTAVPETPLAAAAAAQDAAAEQLSRRGADGGGGGGSCGGSSAQASGSGAAAAAAAAAAEQEEAQAAAAAAARPALFECVRSDAAAAADDGGSSSAHRTRFEWRRLSVYDDQDLAPDACYLLLCQCSARAAAFAWIGREFAAAHVRALPPREFLAAVSACSEQWPAGVDAGAAVVEMPEAESDEFWAAFEAGY